MKFKTLFPLLILLLGLVQLNGQPPVIAHDVAVSADDIKGHDRPCAVVQSRQECNDQGEIEVSLFISNFTQFTIDYIRVYTSNGTILANVAGLSIAPNTSSNVPITFTLPPGTTGDFCFFVKLFSLGRDCCTVRHCIRVEECPCAEIDNVTMECDDHDPDMYDLCFDITNPPYSTNTIDLVTVITTDPNVCINGNPLVATISISPLPPGSSTTVCFTVEGCSGPLNPGDIIGFDVLLEELSDPDYCCHLPMRITVPECCVPDLDCTDIDTSLQIRTPIDFFLQGVSNVDGFLCITFDPWGVPDELEVSINGAFVINTGAYSATGWTNGTCGVVPANGVLVAQVPISVCDEILIEAFGNVCNENNTFYDLDIVCQSTPCNVIGPGGGGISAALASSEQELGSQSDTAKRMAQPGATPSFSVFPNPVRDILTVKNSDTEREYEIIRVLDATGKVILDQGMSSSNEERLDVSGLPNGIYFLEAYDTNGDKVIERFVKS